MGRDLELKNARERKYYADQTEEQRAARRARNTASNKAWRDRNRVSYNAKRSTYGKARSRQLRDEIIEKLGGVCSRCKFTDWRALQIHHRNGGGGAHRKAQGGYHYFRTILDRITEFELLCANCHMIDTWRQDEVAA